MVWSLLAQFNIDTTGPLRYDGEVRLVDGRNPHEGRVEVCLNETWGKICDYISIYGWNRTEAEVVCQQLGYTGASEQKRKNLTNDHYYYFHLCMAYYAVFVFVLI